MAFAGLKKLFRRKEVSKAPPPRLSREEASQKNITRTSYVRPVKKRRVFKRKMVKVQGNADRRFVRSDASPYTVRPALQRVAVDSIEQTIRKNPSRFKTDKLTLMEIADLILEKEIQMPRPAKLRAHQVFFMFAKKAGRIRANVSTPCLEWQGAHKGGAPVLTTVNAIQGKRLIVDARKYILENPPTGERRNFRSKPYNICGNPLCVNTKHIEMRGMPREMKSGENHARAKYSDKDVQKLVREYNAGATAKELAKKWGMALTYVEQVMRKERRTEATEGMTIRGRFKQY